ncbi:glycerophosphoryl diester phosphodiesterase membrane domain-containing protein [Qipengyuania gelatinilytica]|uniref:Glycerophosphoryl diester phosphodiesterase membrane domain-containing protein n=1 Tax=Qipengyuania gelatinilytica TaxID=2867231 RepID=A0ABX9A4B9_9SPHN|nr:glycerophosphoryl diester phosphodiesterase membrane domain-containing protein [Qipengyuania gelatinilytica]QZD94672.1 glycerophosphoryl diester phosphodiesterase membrane domain-containing protein [Qipengyuania gelatinilytica]
MKFDLDTAWKDTSRLLRDNFGLLAVIAGVFFFIPYAAIMIGIPGMAEIGQMQGDPGSEAMEAAILDLYGSYWWVFLLMAIVQGIGMLALLALLRHRDRPTVGDAIKTGVSAFLAYFGAQILQTLALIGVAFVLVGVPIAAGLGAIAFLTAILAIVAVAYIATKFSLASPVIAIDGERNPINALSRSWRLTKGNSVRLFFFYLLILVAFIIVSAVFSLVVTLIFAFGGPDVMLFGTSIVSSAVNAFFIMLMACILAAVHMQMTRLKNTGGVEPEA